jgi:hypothetical protein
MHCGDCEEKDLVEVEVEVLPYCDSCMFIHNKHVEAYADCKTKHGAWANLCKPCFMCDGIGLGTGIGQVLKVVKK